MYETQEADDLGTPVPFELHDLQPEDAPVMSSRDRGVAWALGISGAAAGIVVASALVTAVLYFLAASPLLAWWGMLAAFG